MSAWKTCPAVEQDPAKVSGAWVFEGTRVPLASLFENLRDGATVDQFLSWFPAWSVGRSRAFSTRRPGILRTRCLENTVRSRGTGAAGQGSGEA